MLASSELLRIAAEEHIGRGVPPGGHAFQGNLAAEHTRSHRNHLKVRSDAFEYICICNAWLVELSNPTGHTAIQREEISIAYYRQCDEICSHF